MADFNIEGIVLRSANYREADRMLTLLSPTHGRVEVIARGCRKTTSRLLAASQMFATGEFTLHERLGRLSVRGAMIRESFFDVAKDYDAYQNAVYAADRCLRAAQPGQAAPELFSLALETLAHFSYGAQRPGRVTAIFLAKLSVALGIRPIVDACATCGSLVTEDLRWLPGAGGLVCARCHPAAMRVEPGMLEALRLCLRAENFDVDIDDEALRAARALMMRFMDEVLMG